MELDCELLARLIGGEYRAVLAERLIESCGDLRSVLLSSAEELQRVVGIGPATAARLRAVAEILQRVENTAPARLVVRGSADAYSVFRALAWEQQEVVSAAFLDCRNRLIRRAVIFRGTLESAPARPREILREALRANSARLVVAHNHPSGNLDPSEEDAAFTVKLSKAAETVGIPLLDHLIVGRGGRFFSFADAKQLARPVRALGR